MTTATTPKPKRRASGWRRIGITASVLWIIGVGIWGWVSVVPAAMTGWIPYVYDLCLQDKSKIRDCSQELKKNQKWIRGEGATVAALYAFPPVIIGWPLIWGILALARWIRAGFREGRRDQ